MILLKERIGKMLEYLQEQVYPKQVAIPSYKMIRTDERCLDVNNLDTSSWTEITNQELWGGHREYYWFETVVTIPEEFDGECVVYELKTGKEGEWDATNPQFSIFVNGVRVQGLDVNHREIILAEPAKAGDTYRIVLSAFTGDQNFSLKMNSSLKVLDRKTEKYYYDLEVPYQSARLLNTEDQAYITIIQALNESLNLLDMRKEGSKEYYQSLEKAQEYITKEFYEKYCDGEKSPIIYCVGHTHIDCAWLWTLRVTEDKAVRSFSTVLELMKEYPEYVFMSSQPQLYKYVKKNAPDVYEQIKERVKEGRWEPEGGMWVEADCNLTSGESLVRQFLFGKRFFKEEFGVDNKILWLPDVFGYSAAMPQILKKCGIDYFMTTKLAWNEFNKVPYDTMNWEGIDGSEVFTHMITTLGVGQPETSFFTTYNGMLHPDAIMGGWDRYQNKDINNDILISYGYGDGGGGPTRRMLETSKRMEKGIKGVPKVRQAFARTYFDELHEKVKDSKRLPTWIGELYFEFHRGTYTSMARNKRGNRKSEYAMMELELLSVLAENAGKAYPTEELNRMWEMILTNQFHDILPGSSIHEVYEQTKKEYAEIAETSAKLIGERMEALCGTKDESVTVWNTLGHRRNDVVVLGETAAEAMTDGTTVYPVQQTKDGAIVYAENLPSKGYQVLRPTSGAAAETPFAVTEAGEGYTLETPFYTIQIDANGEFTSLFDKENDREVLQSGTTGNELRIYEDKPLQYSAWNLDIFHTEKSWKVEGVRRMEWTENGPVRATLEIEREVMDTVIRQQIHFYAKDRRIDFETYVDWKFAEHVLKVHFPVDVHSDEATFDIQFGNVTRKLHTNTSWDQARFEVCGHKWADISEGSYGVSLMNDCKYGYSMKNRVMTQTLIKSGTEPNLTADQEEHFFTYSLYPHAGTWREAGTEQEALNLNVPAKAVAGAAEKDRMEFLSVDKRDVVLETVKKAEDGDGVIVRLYEVENARTKVTLHCAEAIASAEETDLLENPIEGALGVKENEIELTIKPYEIRTIRIRTAK